MEANNTDQLDIVGYKFKGRFGGVNGCSFLENPDGSRAP